MKYLLYLIFALPALAMDVATLHPLLTDVVRGVGGSRVNVVEVARPGTNIHQFQPRAADIRKMAKARLIFASGKKLEAYLGDLEDSLQDHQLIIQVGRTIPSQKVSAKDQIYSCCPTHSFGSIDPHWWHNVRNMERAVRVIERALSKADPAGAAAYSANAKSQTAKLRQLDRWVKSQVSSIPRKKRHLVTAHAAFGYFCKAYGFKATFVQGLSSKGEVPAKQLSDSIRQLKKEQIPVVFPEQNANPKILKQIAKQSGAKIGKPLIADGSVSSYEKMIKNNVSNIVAGLRQ